MTKELTKLTDASGKVVSIPVSLSDIPPDDDSPLSALTPMMLKWVEGFLALAGEYGAMTRAAEYAGYAEGTWAVTGSRLHRDPRITAVIKYLAEKKAHISAYAAMSTMEQLMRTGTDAIRMKAAKELLGHAGVLLATIHQHEHTVKDNRDEEQIEKSIQEKMKTLGLGEMIVVPHKNTRESGERKASQDEGPPKWKRQLIPNRAPTEEEIDDMDWMDVEV
jgi:phage terminase small subunit